MYNHVGSIRLTLLDLHNRGDIGHHDSGGYIQLLCVIAQSLGVVAEGSRYDAATLGLLREEKQSVSRTSFLKAVKKKATG